jgi:ABC-2 type transport system ATP-binding protein
MSSETKPLPIVEVLNLRKKYGTIQALKGISFSIGKGEIVGFLGPNGAGKSTTLRILSGLIPADSGEAKVCGVDLAEEEGEVRRHIGYLAENNPLPEDLRVIEYLNFRARLKGLEGSRKRERTRIVLDICDLERKVSERKIGNLSKGFRQRVGIADALLAEPRLVILDEPTIGLDPRQSAITRKMMERLRGEVSFLLSSHILSEVEACCDRMIILSHGQIVAEGTLLELQKEFINSTVFEIVAHGNRIDLQRVIRKIDESCELVQDDPVEVTGKRRFTFSTEKGSEVAENILRRLLEIEQFKVTEFQITRPDLETIFLRATKKNWEDQDLLGRKKKRPLVANEQNS